MNKILTLLFASLFAVSCSTSSVKPSINVGDTRLAISMDMSNFDLTTSDTDDTTPPYGEGTSSSDLDLELTVGRVVITNLELGGRLVMNNSETTYTDFDRTETFDTMALGAYVRYYVPMGASFVPWVEASILFGGGHESTYSEPGFSSTSEADVWGTELALGVSSYLSESTALELALRMQTLELSNFESGFVFPDGYEDERSGTSLTLGISTFF